MKQNKLSPAQKGVFTGMATACAASVLMISFAPSIVPTRFVRGYTSSNFASDKLVFALKLDVLFVVPSLIFSVGAIAKHRFFCKEDIDGSGFSQGTEKVNILRACLQNTVEQVAIAIPTHMAYACVVPNAGPSLFCVCASFAIGRLLFNLGYSKGASARSFGFAFTFYPSVILWAFTFAYTAKTMI